MLYTVVVTGGYEELGMTIDLPEKSHPAALQLTEEIEALDGAAVFPRQRHVAPQILYSREVRRGR